MEEQDICTIEQCDRCKKIRSTCIVTGEKIINTLEQNQQEFDDEGGWNLD